MKIIDLLNVWVKDKTKLPKKVKVDNEIFEYDEDCNLYKTPDKDCYLIQNYLTCMEKLYKEVEVIEENKEIEELNKISYNEFKYTDTKHRFDLTNIEYDKINEIVRAVNKINKQLEEQETEDIDTVERELNKMFKEREEK